MFHNRVHKILIVLILLQVSCSDTPSKDDRRIAFSKDSEKPSSGEGSSKQEKITWLQSSDASVEAPAWYAMTFPSAQVGYAIGGADWNAEKKGPAYLGKTIDGGKTWKRSKIPETYSWMRGIACQDESNCWIAGCSSPKIRLTKDGGETWQGANDNYGWPGCLWSIGYTGKPGSVLAGTTGFADEDSRRASMLRSQDGMNFDALVATNVIEYVVWDYHCPSPGVCYSAAKMSSYITKDNGETLKRVNAPKDWEYRGVYYGVWCTDDNTCWQAGGSIKDEGQGVFIIKTTDGGDSWTQQDSKSEYSGRPRLWNIQMLDNSTGYAVGCKNAANSSLETCDGDGLILYTEDGLLWKEFSLPSGAKDIADLWVLGKNKLVILEWSGKTWYTSVTTE